VEGLMALATDFKDAIVNGLCRTPGLEDSLKNLL
jgi:hypothetical protein